MSFSSCMSGDPLNSEPSIPLLLQNKKKERLGNIRLGGPLVTPHQKYQTSLIPPRPNGARYISNIIEQIIDNNAIKQNRESSGIMPQKKQPVIPMRQFLAHSIQRDQEIQEEEISNDGNFEVRRNLDKNLNLIYKQLRERKQSKSQIRPRVQKLSQKLVAEYINVIYQDYNIPDPMGQFRNRTEKEDLAETIKVIHRRSQVGGNSSSANRKAVQLKESFLIDMFSPSENRYHEESPHRNKNIGEEGDTQEYSEDSKRFTSSNKKRRKGLEQIQQLEGEVSVKDRYRYCFICEEPILQCNISQHEREKCPQFSSLYSLTLFELRQALKRKIQKLQVQSEDYLASLFDPRTGQPKMLDHFQHLHDQARIYLNILNQKVKGNQISKAEIKYHYGTVIDCYEANYFKLYENLNKIQWFVLMLKNLEDKYSKQFEQQERQSFS